MWSSLGCSCLGVSVLPGLRCLFPLLSFQLLGLQIHSLPFSPFSFWDPYNVNTSMLDHTLYAYSRGLLNCPHLILFYVQPQWFLLPCLLSFMNSFLFPRNTFFKKASSLYYSIIFHLFENTNENGYLRFPFPVIVSLSSKFSLCKFICTLTSRLEDFLTNWNYL